MVFRGSWFRSDVAGPELVARIGRLLGMMSLVAICGAGCSDRGVRVPTEPAYQAPTADSPQSALRLLEWSWNRRDLGSYSSLLSGDFVFQCGALDPNGVPYRDVPWTREDELIGVGGLFERASITLTLDRDFRVANDPRPGRDSRWHRAIRSSFSIRALTDIDVVHATGSGTFFFVRGDSALIPQDQIERGVVRDSTRWLLERWEDESADSPGMRTTPAGAATMCQLKARYR